MKLLKLELLRMSPEAKYFLMAFIREFGVGTPVKKTVKEISCLLKVSTSVVTRTTEFLVESGLFRKGDIPLLRQRGRPRWSYSCTDRLVDLLERYDSCECIHESMIESIFNRAIVKQKDSDRRILKTSNKLLLVVMLAYADECGVVRVLGRSDLMRLTSMSRDRLIGQIDMLLSEGYIKFYEPGSTNRLLFGAGKGAYFLDLKKISPREAPEVERIVIHEVLTELLIRELYTKTQLLLKEKSSTKKLDLVIGGYEVNDVKLLLAFFGTMPPKVFLSFLELKLNEYAAVILSNNWANLTSQIAFMDEKVMERIRNDIMPNSLSLRSSDIMPSSDSWDAVAKLIYTLSLKVATHIARGQKGLNSFDFCNLNQVILPSKVVFQGTMIDLHPRLGSA
jgi:hypothetical protein